MTGRTTEELLKDADEVAGTWELPQHYDAVDSLRMEQINVLVQLIAELAAKLKEREESVTILHDREDELQDWLGEYEIKLGLLQIQYEHLTDKELDKHEWKAQHKEWHKQADSVEGLQLTPPKKES